MATLPLSLRDLRREQRRVAALLQKEHAIRVVKPSRRSLLPPNAHVCMCSHIDPSGQNTHHAWNWHRPNLLTLRSDRKQQPVRVPGGAEYYGRDCCSGRAHYGSECDSHLHSAGRADSSDAPKKSATCRRRQRERKSISSQSQDGILYRKDIENFRYASLRHSDTAIPKGQCPDKGKSFLMHVPDNTPIGTADFTRGRDRTFFLPPIVKETDESQQLNPRVQYKHGVIDMGAPESQSYEDFVIQFDKQHESDGVRRGIQEMHAGKNGYTITGVCRCVSPLLHKRDNYSKLLKESPESSRAVNVGGVGRCGECDGTDGTHASWCTVDMYTSLRNAKEVVNDTSRKPQGGQWLARIATCERCGNRVQMRDGTNIRQRDSLRNDVEREGGLQSSTSGIYTMSRNNTKYSLSDSMGFRCEQSEAEYSFHFGTERTDSELHLVKSKTSLSVEGSQLMQADTDRLGMYSRGKSRDLPRSRERKTAKNGSDGEVLHSGSSNILKLGVSSLTLLEADASCTAEKMGELDRKFREGAFDFDTDVDISKVDTTLRMPSDQQHVDESDSALESSVNIQNSLTSGSHRPQIFPDGSRIAYVKALAAAQMQNPPKDAWDFAKRITPAYFSYFQHVPQTCPDCNKPVVTSPANQIKRKGKRAEMKHIFGSIDVNDYFPGGKKNPLLNRR